MTQRPLPGRSLEGTEVELPDGRIVWIQWHLAPGVNCQVGLAVRDPLAGTVTWLSPKDHWSPWYAHDVADPLRRKVLVAHEDSPRVLDEDGRSVRQGETPEAFMERVLDRWNDVLREEFGDEEPEPNQSEDPDPLLQIGEMLEDVVVRNNRYARG